VRWWVRRKERRRWEGADGSYKSVCLGEERRLGERGLGGGCGPTSMGGDGNRVGGRESMVDWVEKGENDGDLLGLAWVFCLGEGERGSVDAC
jgi:hypothetical protein